MIPDTPSPEMPVEETAARLERVNVIEAVRRLGSTVLDQFLDDLAPHLAAVQRGEKEADAELRRFLLEAAVSAFVIDEAGGIKAMEQADRAAAQTPARSQKEVVAELTRLTG